MATDKPQRIQAILGELNRAAMDYIYAKASYETTRVTFEAAREKFAGVKRLASEMLTSMDWYMWRQEHPNAMYAAMPIGEAILEVLDNHTYAVAFAYAEGGADKFRPFMSMEKIVEALESGGFEFRSTSPLREVNAALINLAGVTKTSSGYQRDDAEETLKFAQGLLLKKAEKS